MHIIVTAEFGRDLENCTYKFARIHCYECQHSDMESEERRETRLSWRRNCDRECCSIESIEQREVQFSKWRERDRTWCVT